MTGYGCPFTNFGPCASEACMFFMKDSLSGFNCLISQMGYDSAVSHAYSFFGALGKAGDPYTELFLGMRLEVLEVRKQQIQCSLDSLQTVAKLQHVPPSLAIKASEAIKELQVYLSAVDKAIGSASPRKRRKL